MTHDELLAEIDSYAFVFKPKTALRAVVELHKPTVFINPIDNEIRCDDCLYEYPCPTIQAIEEQIK